MSVSRRLWQSRLVPGQLCPLIIPHRNSLPERTGPRQLRSAFSIPMAEARPQKRTPFVTPDPLVSSSLTNPKAVNISGFRPDWMYYYPDFIHKDVLTIDVQETLKELKHIKSFEFAIPNLETRKELDWIDSLGRLGFEPSLVESGVKKRSNAKGIRAARNINIESFYERHKLWERLRKPRIPEFAKKRTIELHSGDMGSVFICWLTSPIREKPHFIDFFHRHESCENTFWERTSWEGNVWDTELHLSFYQLVGEWESQDEFYRKGQTQEMSSLSATLQGEKPVLVTMSFRFIGDLRDRFWTCHFLSSLAYGFSGLVAYQDITNESDMDVYVEKQGQRKLLEMFYFERALNQMRESIDMILTASKRELETQESQAKSERQFEAIHDQSSPLLKVGTTLGKVSQQLELSISVIDQWERRDDTKGHRSRWSAKDQKNHGEKLRALGSKCTSHTQQLRVQLGRLREQRREADQMYNNLMSYRQLQEARTSTQSAADVRLFTYVTIIFLPLSFSSSLFGMDATPSQSTIAVMIPTTIISLLVTLLLLANLKLADRHWSAWIQKKNAETRSRMSDHHSETWQDISRDLEETTRRQLVTQEPQKRLPAESQWWYTFFWLSYVSGLPSSYVRDGIQAPTAFRKESINIPLLVIRLMAALFFAPIAILFFLVYEIVITTVDVIIVAWLRVRLLFETIFNPPKFLDLAAEKRLKEKSELKDEEDGVSEDGSHSVDSAKPSTYIRSDGRPTRIPLQWLGSPPRLLRKRIENLKPFDDDRIVHYWILPRRRSYEEEKALQRQQGFLGKVRLTFQHLVNGMRSAVSKGEKGGDQRQKENGGGEKRKSEHIDV